MLDAHQVGRRLVELCAGNHYVEAVQELYADDIVNIESHGMPGSPKETAGKAAVLAKNKSWIEHHTIHSMKAEGPWPHEDQFIVTFEIDVTAKVGPMAGQRMKMKEAGLYTVRDGKVVKEQFFYSMGG